MEENTVLEVWNFMLNGCTEDRPNFASYCEPMLPPMPVWTMGQGSFFTQLWSVWDP